MDLLRSDRSGDVVSLTNVDLDEFIRRLEMAIPASVENVTYNSPSGAVIGKSATEKVAFYGATPVVQQASTAAGTDATTVQALANALRTALLNLGLIA